MSGRQTLTWQSVSAPDFEASSRMMERASSSFKDAATSFGKASDEVGKEHKFVQDENATKLDALIQSTPPDERQSLFEQMRNAGAVGSAEFGTQKTGALVNAEDNFNQAQKLREDNSLAAKRSIDANNTLLWKQINNLINEGRYTEASLLTQGFEDSAKAHADMLTKAQNSLIMAANIQKAESTITAGMKSAEDTNRTSNVGNVVYELTQNIRQSPTVLNKNANNFLQDVGQFADTPLTAAEHRELVELFNKYSASDNNTEPAEFRKKLNAFINRVKSSREGGSVNDVLTNGVPSAFNGSYDPSTGNRNPQTQTQTYAGSTGTGTDNGNPHTGSTDSNKIPSATGSDASQGTTTPTPTTVSSFKRIPPNTTAAKADVTNKSRQLQQTSGKVINENIPEHLRLPDGVAPFIYDDNGDVDIDALRVEVAKQLLGEQGEGIETIDGIKDAIDKAGKDAIAKNTVVIGDAKLGGASKIEYKRMMSGVTIPIKVDSPSNYISKSTEKFEKGIYTAVTTGKGLKEAIAAAEYACRDGSRSLSAEDKKALKEKLDVIVPQLDTKLGDGTDIEKNAQEVLDAYQTYGKKLQLQDKQAALKPGPAAAWDALIEGEKKDGNGLNEYIGALKKRDTGNDLAAAEFAANYENIFLVRAANSLYQKSEGANRNAAISDPEQAKTFLKENGMDPDNLIKALGSYASSMHPGVEASGTHELVTKKVKEIKEVFGLSDDAAKEYAKEGASYKYLANNGTNKDLWNSPEYKGKWNSGELAGFNAACDKAGINNDDALSMALLRGMDLTTKEGVKEAAKLVKNNPSEFMRNDNPHLVGNLTNELNAITEQSETNKRLAASVNFLDVLLQNSTPTEDEENANSRVAAATSTDGKQTNKESTDGSKPLDTMEFLHTTVKDTLNSDSVGKTDEERAEEEAAHTGVEEVSPEVRAAAAEALKLSSVGESPDGMFDDISYTHLRKSLAKRESSLDYGRVNRFGYAGAYQMGVEALYDLGFITEKALDEFQSKKRSQTAVLADSNSWKGDMSLKMFLKSKEIQDTAYDNHAKSVMRSLRNKKVVTKDTDPADAAGYLYAAHLMGVGNAVKYAKDGIVKKDGNGVPIDEYFELGKKEYLAAQAAIAKAQGKGSDTAVAKVDVGTFKR